MNDCCAKCYFLPSFYNLCKKVSNCQNSFDRFSTDQWQKLSKQRWHASNSDMKLRTFLSVARLSTRVIINKLSYNNCHNGVLGTNYAEIIQETKYLY